MNTNMSAQEHKVFIRANLSHLENFVRNEHWQQARWLMLAMANAAACVIAENGCDESGTLVRQPDELSSVLQDIVGIEHGAFNVGIR